MPILIVFAGSLRAAEPPIIAPISNQVIDQHRTLVIPILVSDPDTHPGSLEVFASSPNSEVFPPGSLVVEGASIGTLYVTPLSNYTGTAIIAVAASDGALSVTNYFQLTIRAAEPPLIPHRVHLDSPFSIRTRTGETVIGNHSRDAKGVNSWTWLNYPGVEPADKIPSIYALNSTPAIVLIRPGVPESESGTFTLEPNGDLRRIGDGFVRDVAFGTNLFVGITSSQIFTSPDGLTWTSRDAPLEPQRPLYRVAYGNGRFVVAGDEQILYSENGIEWTVANRPAVPQWRIPALAFGDGKFVALGHGFGLMGWPLVYSTLISEDGIDWHFTPDPGIGLGQIRDIIYHGGRFVAVGAIGAAGSGLITTSEDGASWTSRFWNAPNLVYGLSETNGAVVATGDTILLTSVDGGITWSGVSWGESQQTIRTDFTGGAVVGSRFLVSGAVGELFQSDSHQIDPRLVAHYPLNGNAFDISGNAFHGEAYGTTAAVDRFGSFNSALSFNGTSDYIDCGNPPAFNFASNFTLTAWVKLNSPSQNRYIIAKYPYTSGYSGANSYGLAVEEASKAYAFVSGNGPGYAEARGLTNLNDNEWHGIAMVYDRAFGIRLYVDGEINRSVAVPDLPMFANAAPLTIGSLTSGFNFAGLIDDVRIYNDALSSTEIRTLHAPTTTQLHIIAQPQNASIELGTNATFKIEIGGTGSSLVQFQWFEDGVLIQGATSATLVTPIQNSPGRKIITVSVRDGSGQVLDSQPVILTVHPPIDINYGLVAHWTFDEPFETTIADKTGNHPAQLQNGTRIEGRVGTGALQLSGTNSYLFVGGLNSPLLLTNITYTFSWWQKWDGQSATHQNIFAMDDGADFSGGYSSYIFANTPHISFVHNDGLIHGAWSTITQAAQSWRNYAVTYDGELLRFYENGLLLKTGPARGPLVQDGDDPLVIGALRLQNGTMTNFFRGAFDDFRIYDRALRAEEIKLLGPDPEISITTQPQGYRIAAGATVTLRISATTVGIDAPLSYQWEFDRSAIPDATNSSLVVTGAAGVTRNVRVRLNAGGLETFSNEVEVETVSPSDARLLLHLDFEEIIDGKLINRANGETNVQILGTLSLLPGRVDEFGIGMDGLGYLQVPAAGTDLELVGSSYTIAWWMRQTRQGNTPLYALGDYLSSVRNGYAGILHLGGAQFHAHHASSQTGGTIADPPVTLNLPRWTNWLHVAVVYNGAQRLVFTNGLLAASRPAVGPIVGSGRDDLYIGISSFGVLDDFRIYNYALASDELATLVNSAAPETRIQVSLQDGAVLIRWPDAGAVQYRVDYSTTLGPTASWQPLTAPSQTSGGYIQVQPPTSGEARYFRLRKL